MMTCSFLLASLVVLRGNFLLSSTRFSRSLAVGLSDFSGHGNRLPCSDGSSPCKASQESAWPPPPAQPGLLKKVSNQQGPDTLLPLHSWEPAPFFFHVLSSYCTVVSVFERTCTLDGRVESGGSWGEWRWVSRETTAPWGSSRNSNKSLPPTMSCLVVTVVESTGSHLFMKPTIES